MTSEQTTRTYETRRLSDGRYAVVNTTHASPRIFFKFQSQEQATRACAILNNSTLGTKPPGKN